MAKVNKEENSKTGKRRQQTVRERTQTISGARTRRIRQTTGRLASPLKKANTAGKREFHLPLPDNRTGQILSKRVRLFPRFVREAWQEIRQVTWPTYRETVRLTIAVFIFAVVFAVIVGALDYGLDKLFKEVIIKQ